MGYSKKYSSLQEIRAEISQLVPMYSGLRSSQEASWVKQTSATRLFRPDGVGEPIHFSPVTSTDGKTYQKEYPFKAILGSAQYHLGSGTRTGHSNRIKDFGLRGEVEISPEDGARLNLKEGDHVRISSPYGQICREVMLKKGLRPGLIFIPMAFHNNDARQLIELTRLGLVDSPGWKECQVKLEKIED